MTQQLRLIFFFIILTGITVGLTLAACTVPGMTPSPAEPKSTPAVTLSYPETGQAFQVGEEVKVQSTSVDTEGVARVELLINGEVVRIDANAQPQPNTPFIVAQPWLPDVPGSYLVQVRVYNSAGGAAETSPMTVEVSQAAQAAGVSPLPSSTGQPGPAEATPAPTGFTDAPAPMATATAGTTATAAGATATAALPAVTPSPTPTPGSFADTGLEPEGRFYDIWQEVGGGQSRLGYPTAPVIATQNYAKQFFEQGLMYWWDNPDGADYIWVIDSPAPDLNSGQTWNRYVDAWEGQDPFACDEARSNGEKGPMRGFGQLWCSQSELQKRLGSPWEREGGSAGEPPFSRVQFFQGGVIIYNPINAEVYVLFDQGDWLRFGY